MKRTLTTIAILAALLPSSSFAVETHLDIMVPELMDTDLSGPVKNVDTKVSVNVSGKFERERQEYDRIGNLLNETEWDAEGECLNSMTNYYDESGNFERQLYLDFEDEFTNDWEVILSPDTHQIAMKKKSGSVALYTYSPAGYLIKYRYIGSDKKLRSASITKRDEKNRSKEYTRMDDGKKPLYTYWFKWKEGGVIDRERQRYRQEAGERLHIYDYLKTDAQGNWTQRLMARYDIGGKKKEKVYERLVARTIEYFEEEAPAETEILNTTLTNATEEASSESTNTLTSTESTNKVSAVDSTNTVAAASTPDSEETEKKPDIDPAESAPSSAGSDLPEETSDNEGEEENKVGSLDKPEKTQEDFRAEFDYTFDDISDKLVIITCKSDAGRSAGSGFVAKMDGRTYLFTNQHVIMGANTIRFKTADGEILLPRRIELSKTRDIARILIEDQNGFTICKKFAMGIPVGVFGNSEGAGVATELFGEVTDLGVDLVEVTAEFVSGNSGSPVLNPNQEVIGIASYVRVLWEPPSEDEDEDEGEDDDEDEDEDGEEEEDEQKSKTRRFCYRLTDVEWQPVKWKKYNDKYGKLYRNSEAMSASIFDIVSIWADAPLEKIPNNDGIPHDLSEWIKKHNSLIDRYQRREFKKRGFLNAYSESLKVLSKTCYDHSRRIRMFSSQRELTGFLRQEFKNQAYSLEYAGNYFQTFADDI